MACFLNSQRNAYHCSKVPKKQTFVYDETPSVLAERVSLSGAGGTQQIFCDLKVYSATETFTEAF